MSNKGALDLLADYGSNSSDEEVPGSRVSTKRMHRGDEDEPHTKRLEKLPVPKFMLNNAETTIIDDTALHEGRIRSFPHERGNWATYVYIPFEHNEGLEALLSSITNSVPNIELKYPNDFHISLTKTVILKHHWIDPFINTLKENLSYFTKFIIMFSSLDIYCNEEKTRTFIGLQIKTGYDSLLRLVQCLDNCLKEFNLAKFYENPSFHISIAWCLGDHRDELKLHLPVLNSNLQNIMSEYPQDNWYIYVQQIMCRTGNKLFQFHLT